MNSNRNTKDQLIKKQELFSFRSGDAYTRLRAEYESIIRDLNNTIKKLQKERDEKRKKALKDFLFLSNPLVDPDNNLCERKTRILKGK